MTSYDDEHIAELLGTLRPAPERAVRAAQELPLLAGTVEAIVDRARRDDTYRRALLHDLEAALEAEGHRPDEALVERVRSRLSDL
jgi:hypothetical protein